MKAKSIKGKSPEDIKTALEQNMADGFKPTVAIVSISINQNREAVSDVLDSAGISIYGATTNGEFKGMPIMLPGLHVNWKDGSFICSGSLPQGSKVRFSLPPDSDVIDKVISGVEELKATEMPEADALIVFSCAGRLASLGPLMGTSRCIT